MNAQKSFSITFLAFLVAVSVLLQTAIATYNFRYPIISSATQPYTVFSVNDTYGVGGHFIWTRNATAGESLYLHCENSGCATGDVAVFNQTTERNWENASSRTGNNPTLVYDKDMVLNAHHEEIATAYDSSRYGFDGSLTGSPTLADGVFGNAPYITSTGQYYDFGDKPEFSGTQNGELTVMFWFNVTASHSKGRDLVTKFGYHPREWSTYIIQTPHVYANGLTWEFGCSGGGCCRLGSDFASYGGGVSLVPVHNQWYLVTLLANNTDCWIYVNTTLRGSGRAYQGIPFLVDTNHHVFVGRETRWSNGVNLVMDEVRIYNRTLSKTEITEVFNSGLNALTNLGAEESLNSPPDQPVLVSPLNDTVVIVPANLSVFVTDSNGDNMNVSFYTGAGSLLGFIENVTNGTNVSVSWSPTVLQNVTWYVNVTDGESVTQSPFWTFFANDEPVPLNMHVLYRNVSSITFSWDYPLDGEWIAMAVVEEAETIRQTITVRDNWTASALKWNRVYNFTHQSGDIYDSIGNYYSFLVKTDGWMDDYMGILGYKRQITVDDVVSADLDNYLVNVSITDENFDFAHLNDTVTGSDIRFVEFEGVNELAYDLTYINVSGDGGQSMQIVPNSTNCVGNWVDCNKSYDMDYNTLASPFIYTNATVYFNYTIPTGAKASSKWTVKDGNGWGWQMDMVDDCFIGDSELKLKAEANYNDTSVEWSCQNNTDDSWVRMRYENTSYHVYYTEIIWYFSAVAYITVNVSHLDANYSTRFWMFYGGSTTDNSTTLSGFNGTWQDTTIGAEIAYMAPTPELTDVIVEEINSTAVNVSWNVSMTADSRVRYSLNRWFVGESVSQYSNYTDIVVINISGLTTDTIWYFDAVSCDNTNLSNCGNNTANFTLGVLPSMPNVSILSYSENRPDEEVRVCVDLVDTDGQNITLYLEYYELGSPYEVFNISDNVTTTVPIIACFTVPVNYGERYVYRGVALGNVSTGYSDGYYNEFLEIQGFFAGNPVTDDDDNRIRAHSGYREGSCQSEDFMWIETNLTGIGDIRVRWWNGTWTFIPMNDDPDSIMWYLNMTGLDQTWVTFEIWNDTAMHLNWTKPSLRHPLAQPNLPERKYVSFACTPEPINYTLLYLDSLPYYNSVYRWCIASGGNLYECMMAEYYGGGRESGLGADRTGYAWERGSMFRGGITNGESFDTGVINPDRGDHSFDKNRNYLPDGYPLAYGEVADISHANGIPNGSDEYRYCYAFLDFWWNETLIPENGISSYYVHFWHSDQMFSIYFWEPQDYRFDTISMFKWQFDEVTWTRDFSSISETVLTKRNDVMTEIGTTFNATYDESLSIYYKSFDELILDSGSDSVIYDYGLYIDAMWTNVMHGRYQQAFIIFNLPDNATLQGMDSDGDGLTDFDELFIHYTNPQSADTDEGGNSDGLEVRHGMNPNVWADDDTTPPTITIHDPQAIPYGNLVNVPVNITFGEAVNWTGSQVEGYEIAFQYTNVTSVVGAISPLPVGTYNFTVYANDTLGNMGSDSVVFEVYYTGVQQILNEAGSGLGGFLVGITDPTVTFVLQLGFVAGILVVVYGIALAVKGLFTGGAVDGE